MSIVGRILNLASRSRVEKEIDSEISAHIEMRTADNLAAGMTPEQARRDALVRFGNRGAVRERAAAEDTGVFLDSIWRDLHYSARQLRKSPSFTLTAMLTLAVSIGANVVVFSVLNALLLRPPQAPGAEGLYNVVQGPHGYDNQSYPDYLDYQQRNHTFRDMAAYRFLPGGLSTGGAAYKTWFYEVSGNYFDMLGVQPIAGRLLHASDEHGPNSAPYIVLAENFWRTHFHGDPAVVGSMIAVNDHPFTVIGVAPASFHGTDIFLWPDFWVPMVNQSEIEGSDMLGKRTAHGLWILGALKPGVSAEQATENLNAVAAQLGKQYPSADDGMRARLVRPGLMGDVLGDPTRAFLFGIMSLAVLVLLAACTNLASIFAARASDRGRELAIRLALGSSRWHVVRELLLEAILLSVIGGAVGTCASAILLATLTRWQPFTEFPVHLAVVPDVRVYLVAMLLSLGSGFLFGLLPARQVWQADAAQVIKAGATGKIVFRRFTLRDVLLAIQIALCTLLVTSSMVALRGMQRSLHAPLGFLPQNATLAETDMHMAGYSGQQALALQKRMLAEAAQIPGERAVGMIDDWPLGSGGSSGYVWRQGATEFRTSQSVMAPQEFTISPGYLEAAGTRLLLGRDFTWHDDDRAPNVALVNQTFAKRMFGTAPAIGSHFMTGAKESYEIVGVVENGKYSSLTEEPLPAMFFSLPQNSASDTTLVVNSSLPSGQVVHELSRILPAIAPNLPFTIHSWRDALAFDFFPAQVATVSLGVMGLLAAMLAVTGIFGMALYSVSRRMRELGVRVALGARPMQVMRSALGRPLLLLGVGSAVGVMLALVASGLLAQIVYQATPRDPFVLAGVVATMALIVTLAIWVPARHALSIEPSSLLRED